MSAVPSYESIPVLEELEKSGFSSTQARSIISASAETARFVLREFEVATRQDIGLVRQDLEVFRTENAVAQANIRKDMELGFEKARNELLQANQELRADMELGFEKARNEMLQANQELRTDMELGFEKARNELLQANQELRTDMELGFEKARNEMLDAIRVGNDKTIKWFVSLMLGMSTLIIAAFGIAIGLVRQ